MSGPLTASLRPHLFMRTAAYIYMSIALVIIYQILYLTFDMLLYYGHMSYSVFIICCCLEPDPILLDMDR